MVKFSEQVIEKAQQQERNDLVAKQQQEIERLLDDHKKQLEKYNINRRAEIDKLLTIFDEYKDIKELEGTVFKQGKNLCSLDDMFIKEIFKQFDIDFTWNNEDKCYEFSCRPNTKIERLQNQINALQAQLDNEKNKLK